ncbi:MAG: hypothetical protein K8S00_03415 [Bacteroidales bacterium]|nr:hypothetical protein [Bacteroidales bacterium]
MHKKKTIWEFPWKYKESFTIAIALLITGFAIEYFIGKNIIWLPTWPTNLIIIIAFWAYFIFLDRYVKHPIINWLSSTYAAISAISVFTALILLMGFIIQSDKGTPSFISSIGLTHVTSSWPYLITSMYLMIILGFTITRRFFPLRIKNLTFFLNHGGLWLVIAAASLGSADSWKLSMVLNEGEQSNIAGDSRNRNLFEMPFKLELLDFDIEEFPPNLGLLSIKTGKLIIEKGDKLIEVEAGYEDKVGDWNIIVETYYPSAVVDGDKYVVSEVMGSVHAVFIVAENLLSDEKRSGWVTNGSMMYSPEYLILDNDHSIVMTIPTPKKYSSQIKVFYPNGDIEDVFIEVNKPARILDWVIYQVGYDEKMGKWSKSSILEVVRDPWLPVVYVGIFMILAGSLYLVWMGRTKN